MEKGDPPMMEANGFNKPAAEEPPPPPYNPSAGGAGWTDPVTSQPQSPVVQQTVIIQAPVFGDKPMEAMCYTCNRPVLTHVKTSVNIICCLLFGLWSCCCPGCQDIEHYCPYCNALLGRQKAV